MNMRILIAFGISLVATLCVMPILIPYLHKIKFGQVEREEGLASHKKKGGTPTMGGIVFVLIPIIVCAFLDINMFSDLKVLIVMLAYLGYALIGFIDDFIIVVKKNNEGLPPKVKFLLQSILAVAFYLLYQNFAQTTLWIPILDIYIELGWFYFFFVFIMFTAESNAVNLTDGLDGLCAGTCIIAIAPFLLFACMEHNYRLAILLAAIIGALLGYLKFNVHPAKIFMGDTGSLA
ncbi:MAG: phospho-N-acetylmuramoyl-pentapeptide-transferase, partial [Erysipelotrichia bacterium]|nr:phospho-N-acetylmuramoyl-pentapeptide-transferase [Erysipelotrichia bacterium]